jgi:5-methylcytosine-specific restriction endonuclease McrA
MSAADNGYALSVHHVNYIKTDNRMANLVTLCRWCHGSMHGKPESRERWTMYWSRVLSESVLPSASTTCELPLETISLAVC